MNGYNNNPRVPVIDLEAAGLLVFRDFEQLKERAFVGAALSRGHFLTAKIGQHVTVWQPEEGHIELMTLYRQIISDPKHESHKMLRALGVKAGGEYLKWKYPTLYIGSSLSIRNTPDGNYNDKHLYEKTINMPCATNFSWLKDEVESWGIFEQFGRVILFANDHHSYTPIHRDWDKQDEFVWIGHSDNKHFFVYDEQTGTKHYVTGRANTFSNADYHGSDPSTRAGISLRVDGVFTTHVRDTLRDLTCSNSFSPQA